MAVTLYVLDTLQQVRQVLVDKASRLVHTEQEWTIEATIPLEANVRPGEYLGFTCMDGLFRLFRVEEAENEDDTAQTHITATDAAVAELSDMVVEELLQENVTAETAVRELIKNRGWILGEVETGSDKKTSRMYYHTLWEALLELEALYEIRIAPGYRFANGKLIEKEINLYKQEGVFRGRFFESERDASSVSITFSGSPVTRLYGLGKSIATGDNAENLTIANVVWSKAKGDPVDKPKGQTWLEDADAVAGYGRHARVYISTDTEDENELAQLTWEELQRAKEPQVSVSAEVADMETAENGDRKRVRIGDIAAVVPRHGAPVMARVVGVERDYIDPDRTKLTIGNEEDTISTKVASLARGAVHTSETLTIYRNRFKTDEDLIQLNAALIQLNAEAIQLNADSILAQAKQIDLVAGDVEDQHSRITLLQDQVQILSDYIELGGFVTVDGVLEVLENATIKGSLYIEETLDAYTLNGSECYLHNVEVDGYATTWKETDVLTALPGVVFSSTTYTIKDGDGNNRTIVVPVSATLSGGGKKTVRYLGR